MRKDVAREQAGAIGTVTAGGFKDMNVPNAGTTPGATIGAIKLAMQQMHADIVNISEQIAQVMIAVKEVQVVGQDTASNVSHIIISNDTIEEKQLNMELNVEAVYQSLQQIATNGLSMEAGGWHGGGGGAVNKCLILESPAPKAAAPAAESTPPRSARYNPTPFAKRLNKPPNAARSSPSPPTSTTKKKFGSASVVLRPWASRAFVASTPTGRERGRAEKDKYRADGVLRDAL